MNTKAIQKDIIPYLPELWEATSFVDWNHRLTNRLTFPISTFEVHGKEAMGRIGFRWNVKPGRHIEFSAFTDCQPDGSWIPTLVLNVPPNRRNITFQPEQWRYFRFTAFQYLVHEFIHVSQFSGKPPEWNGRTYESKRLLDKIESKQDQKERLYFAQRFEIEAYASDLAIDWLGRYPHMRTWTDFRRHWRKYDVDNPLCRFTALDWYQYHFGTRWTGHPALRHLRSKLLTFVHLYRPRPVWQNIHKSGVV